MVPGIDDETNPRDCSAGQQLALVCAIQLAAAPRVLLLDEPTRGLDYDAKRLHYFEQLFHATDGWVSATSENMSVHVDMTAKKSAAFPPEIAACLAKMKAAHGMLPVPEAAGRRITMPSRT